jgi:hypothetical protein
MENNNNNELEKAPFNIAQDTLKRLSQTLDEIKQLAYKTDYDMETRQAVKIGLVRNFFVQSSPLLLEDFVKKYKLEILKLRPKIVRIIQNRTWNESKYVGQQIIYDEELEFRLDEILIELQIVLQKEGYFMPRAEDEESY